MVGSKNADELGEHVSKLLGANEVSLSFWSGSSARRKGRGFKILISAVNPLCYPIQYDHHYGDYGCKVTNQMGDAFLAIKLKPVGEL